MRDIGSAANYLDYSGYEPFVLSTEKHNAEGFVLVRHFLLMHILVFFSEEHT